MASSPSGLKTEDSIILSCQITAKTGKADELAQWLSNLKVHADSDAEPGTLQYHVVRFGDKFRVWEEYVNGEAHVAHESTSLFLEFRKFDLWEKPEPEFYPAHSLPPPTLKMNH